ncbi:MAG: DUF2182 domain-containing protein, partial [Thaumarchaeota archaeon]|nr:DUF2182 domain-containing protein [Nitrososphaerota archaeon]
FELIWVVGMAAMMFPAMIPIITFYNRFSTKAEPNPPLARVVGTPLFLAGYLAIYAGLGLAVYLAVFFAVGVSSAFPGLAVLGYVAPGAVLILAGAYQLAPRKSSFLMQCVSPMGFFTQHSHRGLFGSFRMGLSHGEYCVGCCWAYMLVMFAVALMSLPFMVMLSVVIALEKVVMHGAVWFTRGNSSGPGPPGPGLADLSRRLGSVVCRPLRGSGPFERQGLAEERVLSGVVERNVRADNPHDL